MKLTLRITFYLFILISFGAFTIKAFAVDQGNLGAYPTNYDPNNPKTKSWFIYELKPGQIKEDSITVVNNSDKALSVKIYPVDATTTRDGAFALLNENQKQQDVGSWVSLSNNTITLNPHERKDVAFTIKIPQNVTVGDHPGGIIVQEAAKPNGAAQGMGVNIVSRVGTRIYETVPGAQIVSLDVRDLQYKIVDDHLVFSFTMENQGNIILTPTGNLDIKDSTGKKLDTISLGTLGAVFPGKPTVLTAKSNIAAPLFGQYTATVTINYSPIKSVAKSLSFFIYVKDWKTAAGGSAVLVVLVILLLVLIKKIFFHAHTVKETKQRETFWKEESSEKPKKIKKAEKSLKPSSTIVQPQPARAAVPEEYVDQLFIAHHIKLLVILISFSIVVLSTLFALAFQEFVLAKNTNGGNSSQQSPTQSNSSINSGSSTPTSSPTPTNTPVAKADIKVSVLNGSGKAGAAKAVAQKLTTDGFTVVKSGNAPQDATQTIIQYPAGKIDGANQLKEELKPDYTNVTEEESTDSAGFTITLGQ